MTRYSVGHGEERPIRNTAPLTKERGLVVNWLLCLCWLPRVTQGRGLLVQKHPVVTTRWACQQSRSAKIINKQTSKKSNSKLQFGRLWTAMRSTCFFFLKGQFTNSKSRLAHEQAGSLREDCSCGDGGFFLDSGPSCFIFRQRLNGNNYILLFNRCASCHSLKIKCGPPNFRQREPYVLTQVLISSAHDCSSFKKKNVKSHTRRCFVHNPKNKQTNQNKSTTREGHARLSTIALN